MVLYSVTKWILIKEEEKWVCKTKKKKNLYAKEKFSAIERSTTEL
jgi:hypothetical protein